MTSATEVLRRMLDERGVEWWQSANTLGCIFTRWYSPLFGDEVCAMENGKEGLVLFDHFMTPEQAIAATLGETPTPPPPTPPKQPPYDELIESLRRDWGIEASWDGLRRFWYVGLTDEGVRKRDEREATLGRGMCDCSNNCTNGERTSDSDATGERMSITDELRKYAQGYKNSHDAWSGIGDDLDEIADRIDEAHKHAIGYVDDRDPETMAENGWVKLPVDADGVPIHVGDELVIFETGALARAYDLELYEGGRWMVCDDEMTDSINPKRLRHRAKTVEDVLDKFANALFGCDNTEESVQRVIAEYAKRLRLAGDE